MQTLTIFLILIDQITKRMAKYYFEKNIFVSILGFSNVLTCNKGISFSLLENYKIAYLLKYISLFFLMILIYKYIYSESQAEKIALNFMISGAISNIIDRFLFKGVIDFIHFNPRIMSPIIFNFADLFLTVGALMLMVQMVLDVSYEKAN